MTLTPNDALIHQAQARPNDTAFIFHDVVWTYQKLASEAERLARALAARGVGPGDRVAVHLMNRPEFVVAYHACFRLGAVWVPTNFRLSPPEVAYLAESSGASIHIIDAAFREQNRLRTERSRESHPTSRSRAA